jgi:uncharacterized membrane protein YsdA (DUF1294 family)
MQTKKLDNIFSTEVVLYYFVIVNIVTFFLYWKDKRSAKLGGWRVSEASLLIVIFLGGTLAALLAQKFLRHKNRKKSYQSKFLIVFTVQLITLLYLGFNWWTN